MTYSANYLAYVARRRQGIKKPKRNTAHNNRQASRVVRCMFIVIGFTALALLGLAFGGILVAAGLASRVAR